MLTAPRLPVAAERREIQRRAASVRRCFPAHFIRRHTSAGRNGRCRCQRADLQIADLHPIQTQRQRQTQMRRQHGRRVRCTRTDLYPRRTQCVDMQVTPPQCVRLPVKLHIAGLQLQIRVLPAQAVQMQRAGKRAAAHADLQTTVGQRNTAREQKLQTALRVHQPAEYHQPRQQENQQHQQQRAQHAARIFFPVVVRVRCRAGGGHQNGIAMLKWKCTPLSRSPRAISNASGPAGVCQRKPIPYPANNSALSSVSLAVPRS